MNRQPFPEEIDAPELNRRGLYVFHGCDASTSRQLARLSQQYLDLNHINHIFDEEYELDKDERLYALTKNRYNQFISHAVIHLGARGLNMFRFVECGDEDEAEFRSTVMRMLPAKYDIAS